MPAETRPAVFNKDTSQADDELPDPLSRGADLVDDSVNAQQLQGELVRRLRDLVNDADDWAQLMKTEQAEGFSKQLRDLYQSFALPVEVKDQTAADSKQSGAGVGASQEEKLQEALRESFPASDPPADY